MNNPASYLRLSVLALLWGSSFLLIKLSLSALSPAQVSFTRIVFGATVLLLLCLFRGFKLGHGLWLKVAIAGLFGSTIPWLMFGIGEQTVSSGLTGVINAMTPLWTVLFGAFFGNGEERIRPLRLAGVGLGFAGVVVILAPWEGDLPGWGVLACLAAPISYGISLVYIGRSVTPYARERGVSPLAVPAMQLTAAAGLSALTLPFGGLQPVHFQPVGLLAIAILGVLGTGFAFALNYHVINDEGPTTASTVTYLIPGVSVVLGWLVLHENLGLRGIAGMVIVLIGVGLSRQAKPRQQATEPPGTTVVGARCPQ